MSDKPTEAPKPKPLEVPAKELEKSNAELNEKIRRGDMKIKRR